MKIIQRIETFDGKVHDDVDAALHHLNVTHADVLSKIAHELVQLQKFTAIGNWVDNHLGLFLDLYAIKQDMVVVKDDSED